MKLLLIFILCSAFIAFKPSEVGKSIIRRPEKVTAAAAVQTASNTGNTTISVTVSSTAANSLLVVSIWGPNSETISSVTDNQSSSYTILGPVTTGGAADKRVWQAYAICAAGVTSVTVTKSSSGVGGVIVDEYSGIDTGDPYDTHATNSGESTSLSVSLSPAAAGKLIVASMGAYLPGTSAWTAGTNYTLYGLVTFVASYDIIRSQYRLSGTTSETAPASFTFSVDDQWAEIATSFNLPSAANTGGFFNFFKP